MLQTLQNYTFCLLYSLKPSLSSSEEDMAQSRIQLELPSSELILFRTCVDVQTQEVPTLWSSLSPTTIGILTMLLLIFSVFFCLRALYLRFYIWHDTKLRFVCFHFSPPLQSCIEYLIVYLSLHWLLFLLLIYCFLSLEFWPRVEDLNGATEK